MRIVGFGEYVILNESYKSSRLRDIIAQYGKPKYSMDNVFLHDLRDDEIGGVFTWKEWYDYHKKNSKSFCIHLQNDYYLAITNPDILTGWFGDEENERDFKKEIERRRNERHKGNELNGLSSWEKRSASVDKTNVNFSKKRDELIHSRNLEKIKEILAGHETELVDALRDFFEDKASEFEFDSGLNCIEDDKFEFLGKQWYVTMEYTAPSNDYEGQVSRYGARYCDVSIPLEKCSISYMEEDEDGPIIEDDFDIKEIIDNESLLRKLFEPYEESDVECGIDDPYSYYGVSRGDFY